MKMIPVIIHKSQSELLFKLLDKKIDDEGYLVEGKNRSQRVITKDGEYIKPNEVGIVRPGSQIFIKNDIASLIKFASDLI